MRISEIISVQRISLDKELLSKKTVLETLGSLLVIEGSELTASCIGDLFSSRERLGTTGLGGGVALPHARIAKGELARAAFLRTLSPVDFDALDDQPVDLFFALCVPEDCINEHLDLLSQLADVLSDACFVQNLRAVQDPDELLLNLLAKVDSAKD
tara:strand:+ start:145 stop:612 length:468 start_codon:yes stop_codon:yes gene_type:complete